MFTECICAKDLNITNDESSLVQVHLHERLFFVFRLLVEIKALAMPL
jgi:hypothetical protein